MTPYILQFEDVTHDIRIVTIQMRKDKKFVYMAGQYVQIHMDGCDPRMFSIANAPRDNNTIDIHVRNSGQNISDKLCSNIKQGETINVSPAQGFLRFIESSNPIVFLAGGTGITPFLAILEDNPTKNAHVYWGMSHEDDFYIRPHRNGLSINYCTDVYPVDAYLTEIIESAIIYISGPPAMIHDSKAKLLAAGVEPTNIIHDEI